MASTRKTNQTQVDRFKDMARKLGADESEEHFERAFGKIVPAKKPGDKPPNPADRSKKGKPGQ